jgi:hypothetical protein
MFDLIWFGMNGASSTDNPQTQHRKILKKVLNNVKFQKIQHPLLH